jgi:hypothetical protein
LTNVEKTSEEIKDRIFNLSFQQTMLHLEVQKIYDELQVQKVLRYSDRIVLLEKIKEAGIGGTNVNATKALADSQVKTLELMNKLGTQKNENGQEVSPVPSINPITTEDILNGDSGYFDDTFAKILAKISIPAQGDNVTLEEFQAALSQQTVNISENIGQKINDLGINITDGINTGTEAIMTGAITAIVTPQLTQIKNQTSQPAISGAVSQGICDQTANPNSCLNTGLKKPLSDKINDIKDGLGIGMDTANLLFSQTILGTLLNLQTFLHKAWNSTTLDKTLNLVSVVLGVHNAMMLSRNLGQTIGDTATLFLQAIHVKDHTGEEIDVNQWITARFTELAQKLLGVEGYATVVASLNAANRIIVAGQGMASAIHGIKDALQEGQEIIANRVATLGNACLEQGLFEDGTYSWMDKDLNLKQPFSKFTTYVSNLTEFVEEVNALIQSGIEVQESTNEFYQNTEDAVKGAEALEKAITDYIDQRNSEEAAKQEESASPDITNLDLIQGETEEP